ncbi:MAG TPA: glycosyltransferase [Polyangiaceae bacterium]|nr:glycosyltransferase [Polyangiaceae bacterium]
MIYHLLCFEGPDDYARAGGAAARVTGLARSLAREAETHLWFVGDPRLPGEETQGQLHLHRWCQWLSEHHPTGVYDGEAAKVDDYTASLPHAVLAQVLAGGQSTVIAEDWHAVHALLHLHDRLHRADLLGQVDLVWNASSTVGFSRVDWAAVAAIATVTTVSRYMRQLILQRGVEAFVVPSGLDASAFEPIDPGWRARVAAALPERTLLAKVARWVREKRWTLAMDTVAALKGRGYRPLLAARGGIEPHREEVLTHARRRGLAVVESALADPGPDGLLQALVQAREADVVLLEGDLGGSALRALFHGADAVLANSSHEPIGMVGLETMAAGGVACTGCTGEDYAVPGQNALVLQTDDPEEFVRLFADLSTRPDGDAGLRAAARATAERYRWESVLETALWPRLRLARAATPPRPVLP